MTVPRPGPQAWQNEDELTCQHTFIHYLKLFPHLFFVNKYLISYWKLFYNMSFKHKKASKLKQKDEQLLLYCITKPSPLIWSEVLTDQPLPSCQFHPSNNLSSSHQSWLCPSDYLTRKNIPHWIVSKVNEPNKQQRRVHILEERQTDFWKNKYQ